MRRRSACLLGLVVLLGRAAPLRAEEALPAPAGLPYALDGGLSVGYRNVDIDGSKAKYREDYNYVSGFRLFDFDLSGAAKEPEKTRLDRFHLQIDTPGNEPVSNFKLTAADRELYDLRINFNRSKYYYAVPRLWEEPVADDVRLDDLHDFNLLRWNGTADLTVRAPHLPTLFFGYRLYKTSGTSTSTVLIPAGDNFLVNAPVDSVTQVGKVGTEFELVGTDFFVQQEYRRVMREFDQDGPLDPVGLDPTDASTLQSWQAGQSEQIGIPATTVRVRRPLGERADLTGAVFYSHANLDSYAYRLRDGTSDAPALSGAALTRDRSDATLDTWVADLGGTVRLTDTLRLNATYRFNERSQDGTLDQSGTYGALATGASDLVRIHSTTGDFEWQARDDLLLRAGLRYAWRQAYFTLTGDRVSTGTLGAIGEARWRPWSFLDLFAKYENAQVDDPLTTRGDPANVPPLPAREIELTFVNRGKAGFRLRPLRWLAFNYQFTSDSRENDSFDANWTAYGNTVGVSVTPRDDLSFGAGFTHRDVDNRSVIYYAPLYARSLSVQRGSEDIVSSELRWDFGLLGQRWSTGWTIAYVDADDTLSPRLEPGLNGYAFYDLDRVDGGTFLTLHHRWLEPTIEFRMIDYNERVLPANDYRATILLFKIGRRFSL